MGYCTTFEGQFDLDRPLDKDTHTLLEGLNKTRRMARKGLDEKLYGVEGEFYVEGDNDDFFKPDSEKDNTIIDYNRHPKTQPGLWCDWRPTPDGLHIEWDGAEKFYHYVAWIEYIVDNILAPRGYVLNGEVTWQGEDSDDRGKITIKNNRVTDKRGKISYAQPKRKIKRTKLQELAWIDKRISDLQKKKKLLRANSK